MNLRVFYLTRRGLSDGYFVLCTTFALVIKTNSVMKEIKIVEKGENFTTVNI